MRNISTTKMIITLVVLSLTSLAFKNIESSDVKGWFIAGSERTSYEIGTETDTERGGKVAYIKSIKPKIKGKFGTIMQSFNADNYLGKKIKLTGFIKTKDLTGWVGMWMRVDGGDKMLSFDNMGNRKIKGNTSWTKYEIILDVPKESTTINYGVLIDETGTAWLDDLIIEEVENKIPITGKPISKEPTNNSFED